MLGQQDQALLNGRHLGTGEGAEEQGPSLLVWVPWDPEPRDPSHDGPARLLQAGGWCRACPHFCNLAAPASEVPGKGSLPRPGAPSLCLLGTSCAWRCGGRRCAWGPELVGPWDGVSSWASGGAAQAPSVEGQPRELVSLCGGNSPHPSWGAQREADPRDPRHGHGSCGPLGRLLS